MLFSLKGEKVVVTGGCSGIGESIATLFQQQGAEVHVIDLNIPSKEVNAKINYHQGDITNFEVVEQIATRISPIDILINNAGIIKRIPLIEMEVSDFKEVVDIDLVSPFIVSKHVVKGMITRKQGKIINICSMMSELGRNGVGAYAAAKGGLKMLTKNMATEWAKHNVQVNGIGPGYFATTQTEPIRVDGHPFNEFIINKD